MRNYELVVILSSPLEEKNQKEFITKIKKITSELKGKVTKVTPWGVKKFSYPIKKQEEGIYLLFDLSLAETKVANLEKEIRSIEKILRHLLIRKE